MIRETGSVGFVSAKERSGIGCTPRVNSHALLKRHSKCGVKWVAYTTHDCGQADKKRELNWFSTAAGACSTYQIGCQVYGRVRCADRFVAVGWSAQRTLPNSPADLDRRRDDDRRGAVRPLHELDPLDLRRRPLRRHRQVRDLLPAGSVNASFEPGTSTTRM